MLGVAVAVAVQAAVVVLLTWPLPSRAAVQLPFTPRVFDSLLVGWALAHETRALTEPGVPLADGGAFHPCSASLLYGEAAFAAVPLFGPAFLATGNPTLALNVTLLVGLLLTAASLHLVTVRWTGSHAAGALAGLVYLATPWVYRTWAPSAPNYALLPFVPWLVLLTAAPSEPRTWRAARVICALVLVQGLVSAYVAAAVLAPLLLLGVARLVRADTRAGGARLLAATVAAGAALAALYTMQLAARGAVAETGNTFWPATFLPPIDLPSGLRSPDLPLAVPAGCLFVIALGGLSRLLRRGAPGGEVERYAWWAAALWVAIGTLISLPPRTAVLGHPVPLPQVLLERWTPLYELFREVYRLGLVAMVGLALLAGLALHELAFRLCSRSGWRARATAGALLVIAATSILLPLAPGLLAFPTWAPVLGNPATAEVLRRGRGPVLELPLHPPLGVPLEHAEAMYRSIAHRRPVLNGYSGYWPPEFPRHMALAQAIPDPDAVAELRRITGLATVVVRADAYKRVLRAICKGAHRARSLARACVYMGREADAKRDAWLALADRGGDGALRLVARNDDELVFDVVPADQVAATPPAKPSAPAAAGVRRPRAGTP